MGRAGRTRHVSDESTALGMIQKAEKPIGTLGRLTRGAGQGEGGRRRARAGPRDRGARERESGRVARAEPPPGCCSATLPKPFVFPQDHRAGELPKPPAPRSAVSKGSGESRWEGSADGQGFRGAWRGAAASPYHSSGSVRAAAGEA